MSGLPLPPEWELRVSPNSAEGGPLEAKGEIMADGMESQNVCWRNFWNRKESVGNITN